jgi:hypothetical protein
MFYKACEKSDRDKALAYAADIADAFRESAPLITQLAPDFAERFNKGVAISAGIIVAVKASQANTVITLLRDLVPIAEQTFARFSSNTQVLTVFALADIGIHFLINHFTGAGGALIIAEGAREDPARAQAAPVVQRYQKRVIWGCQYQPKACTAQ